MFLNWEEWRNARWIKEATITTSCTSGSFLCQHECQENFLRVTKDVVQGVKGKQRRTHSSIPIETFEHIFHFDSLLWMKINTNNDINRIERWILRMVFHSFPVESWNPVSKSIKANASWYNCDDNRSKKLKSREKISSLKLKSTKCKSLTDHFSSLFILLLHRIFVARCLESIVNKRQ